MGTPVYGKDLIGGKKHFSQSCGYRLAQDGFYRLASNPVGRGGVNKEEAY